MLRNALLILLTLTIAIGGGAASAWYALGSIGALDTILVGGWVAYPDAGTPQADPYAKARIRKVGNQLENNFTIIDPTAYDKPWEAKRQFNYVGGQGQRVAEYVCEENNRNVPGPDGKFITVIK